MPDGFKLRRAPKKPKDDALSSTRSGGVPRSSKRTHINVTDLCGRIVFKAKKILAKPFRNSEYFFHIERENIPVNTWEPKKHLDIDDGRTGIQAWEL